MKTLAFKTKRRLLIVGNLIFGCLIMAAGVIGLPVMVFISMPEVLETLFGCGVIAVIMLGFGLVGFFASVRPYYVFRKLPEIQAETDGTYLYIHSLKEAKIPLSEMKGVEVNYELPYMMSYEFIIHILSEQYGKVIIDVPGYGKFKLYFISRAQDAAMMISSLAQI